MKICETIKREVEINVTKGGRESKCTDHFKTDPIIQFSFLKKSSTLLDDNLNPKDFYSIWYFAGDTLKISNVISLDNYRIEIQKKIFDQKVEILTKFVKNGYFKVDFYSENEQISSDNLEVQSHCKEFVLSKIPSLEDKERIYGFIDFETDQFYISNGKYRHKLRMHLKTFFQAKKGCI